MKLTRAAPAIDARITTTRRTFAQIGVFFTGLGEEDDAGRGVAVVVMRRIPPDSGVDAVLRIYPVSEEIAHAPALGAFLSSAAATDVERVETRESQARAMPVR
ncbi:hypothetical protein GCM10009816_08430 [Microbacterium aquimaris]